MGTHRHIHAFRDVVSTSILAPRRGDASARRGMCTTTRFASVESKIILRVCRAGRDRKFGKGGGAFNALRAKKGLARVPSGCSKSRPTLFSLEGVVYIYIGGLRRIPLNRATYTVVCRMQPTTRQKCQNKRHVLLSQPCPRISRLLGDRAAVIKLRDGGAAFDNCEGVLASVSDHILLQYMYYSASSAESFRSR